MAYDEKQDKKYLNNKNNKDNNNKNVNNECSKKDEKGNCLIPGVYSDSDPIGGG